MHMTFTPNLKNLNKKIHNRKYFSNLTRIYIHTLTGLCAIFVAS